MVMRTLDAYTIVIRPDDNGTFVAYLPAIDGCQAWGKTADEARRELACVFDMIAEEYAQSQRPLPPDVDLSITRAS